MIKKKYICSVKNIDENKLYLHTPAKNGKRGPTGPYNSKNIYLSNINNNSILYKNNDGLTGSNNLTYNPSGLGKITFPGIFDPLGIVLNPSLNDINIPNSIWLKDDILRINENTIIDSTTINNYLLGQTGATGPIGNSNNIGITGSQGETGIIGPTGIEGYFGNFGINGIIGNTGYTGIIGQTGETGPVSSIGNTGSTGFIGIDGLQGSIGYTGSTGQIGFTGLQGISSISISNLTGPTGFNGNTGSTGPVASLSGDVSGLPSNNTVNTVGGISSTTISTNINKILNASSLTSNNILSQRDNNGSINYSNITLTNSTNQIKLNNTTLNSTSGFLNTITLPNISDNLISNVSSNLLTNKTINDSSNYVSSDTLRNGNTYNISLGGNFPSNNQLLNYNGSIASWNTFNSGNTISAVILQKISSTGYGQYTQTPWEILDLNNIVNPLNAQWISNLSNGQFTLQPGTYNFDSLIHTNFIYGSALAIYNHTTNSYLFYSTMKSEIILFSDTAHKTLFINTTLNITSENILSLQIYTGNQVNSQNVFNFGDGLELYYRNNNIQGTFVSLQIIKLA